MLQLLSNSPRVDEFIHQLEKTYHLFCMIFYLHFKVVGNKQLLALRRKEIFTKLKSIWNLVENSAVVICILTQNPPTILKLEI